MIRRRRRALCQEETRRDVGGEHTVPILRLPIGQRSPMGHACIRNQNVEAAHLPNDRLQDCAGGGLFGHVEYSGFDLKAPVPQFACRSFQGVGVTAVEDDRGARLGERLSHCKAKTARSACDKRDTSVERE